MKPELWNMKYESWNMNPEFWNLQHEIWNLKYMKLGIRNMKSEIWNPKYPKPEIWNMTYGIRNPKPEIWNMKPQVWNLESRIWNLKPEVAKDLAVKKVSTLHGLPSLSWYDSDDLTEQWRTRCLKKRQACHGPPSHSKLGRSISRAANFSAKRWSRWSKPGICR